MAKSKSNRRDNKKSNNNKNKYNTLAVRRELDNYVRNNSWKKLQSKLSTLVVLRIKQQPCDGAHDGDNDLVLLKSVVLLSTKGSCDGGGSTLLHTLLKHKNETITELVIFIAEKVPEALCVQNMKLEQTPLHVAIDYEQPTIVVKRFLEILKSNNNNNNRRLSFCGVMRTIDRFGDTPLLKATRQDSNQFIPLILRYCCSNYSYNDDCDYDLFSSVLIPKSSNSSRRSSGSSTSTSKKRNLRTSLWYAVSNEFGQNAYKFKQYKLPKEIGLILIATYLALLKVNGKEIPLQDWMFFQQQLQEEGEEEEGEEASSEVVASTTTTTPTPPPQKLKQQRQQDQDQEKEESRRLAIILRALVACSHLMGKYAVKMLDFVLENESSRDTIFTKEIDLITGDYFLHQLCQQRDNITNHQNNNFIPDDDPSLSLSTVSHTIQQQQRRRQENATAASTIITNALLFEQLKRYDQEYVTMIRQPNRTGNLPLHVALQNYNLDFVQDLIQKYPNSLQHSNQQGELPIHVWLKLDVFIAYRNATTTTTQLQYHHQQQQQQSTSSSSSSLDDDDYKIARSFETTKKLWIDCPVVLEVRDGPTQLYPYQLASCCEWGPHITTAFDDRDDDNDAAGQ